MPKVRAKTIWVDRWEKTPARTAQDKIKRRTPAGSSLAGVLLFCTNLTQPTGALDYNTSKDILNLMEEVNQKYGNTIIMVTHNDAIKHMADHVIRLRDGSIRKDYRNEEKIPAMELDW